jgi:hypothetical protein
MATEAAWLKQTNEPRNRKTTLTLTGLLMEGVENFLTANLWLSQNLAHSNGLVTLNAW